MSTDAATRCECGALVTKSNAARHRKSAGHSARLLQQDPAFRDASLPTAQAAAEPPSASATAAPRRRRRPPAEQPTCRQRLTTPSGNPELAEHEATMAKHRTGYLAYKEARKAGDKAQQEANREHHKAWRAAYKAHLSARGGTP
jgi:hypothetical protein